MIIFYLEEMNVPVVRGVKGVGQAQDRCELDACLLLVRKEIAQRLMPARGKSAAMKAGDYGGALQVRWLPTHGIAVSAYQVE